MLREVVEGLEYLVMKKEENVKQDICNKNLGIVIYVEMEEIIPFLVNLATYEH